MVDIVGADHRADVLLQQVVVFVGRLGAGVGGDAVGAVAAANVQQVAGDQIERLVPTGLAPIVGIGGRSALAWRLGRAADERRDQALGAMHVVGAEAAL